MLGQALRESFLTLLVFEAKCPLRVLDVANPQGTCQSTSGPGPLKTDAHCVFMTSKNVAFTHIDFLQPNS